MTEPRHYRAGDRVDDLCRGCKTGREHVVVAADVDGRPARVMCDFCGSQHNFRGGARAEPQRSRAPRAVASEEPFPLVSERERSRNPMHHDESAEGSEDLETMLRRVIREEAGLTAVTPAEKWRGGDLVLRPGREGVQEVSWPIEKFFHKVVMVRNRLRVLEQQINGADMPQDLKIKLQGYISGCYGSLTSFNVLFAADADRFQGSSK